MISNSSGERRDLPDIDLALEELKAGAGISPGAQPIEAFKPPLPNAMPADDSSRLSPSLQLLINLYHKGKVTRAEVYELDRMATIDRIRREGRI